MKKYLKKSLALFLAISVWCSAIPVWAMETQYEENNEIVLETSGDVEEIVSETGGDVEELSGNMEQEMISEDAVIEEADALETDTVLDLNYIYVESPYLETPGTENIVVSLGDGTENISEVKILGYRDNGETFECESTLRADELYLETPGTENIVVSLGDGTENISEVKILGYRDNGETFECESTLRADELYLFSKDFYDEAETGIYSVESITYKIEDVEKQIVLSDVGAVAEFGVNQEYEGYAEAVRATNVVNVENDSVPVVAVLSDDETAEVENNIAEALETVAGDIAENESNGADLQRSSGNELVIAIDPGHDVGDAGAAYNGLREEALTLEIAQYCKKELETYAGVRVHMTRTSSACPYGLAAGGSHAGTCIRNRVRDAAKAGAVIFVSLHLNAAISSGAKGAEIIIPNTSWKPEHNTEGKALAEKILSELTSLGLYNRGYYFKDATDGDKYDNGQIADYFTVQNAGKDYNLPGIIVEHAFISNVGATYFKDATDGDKYDNGQIADYFTVQNAGKDYNLPGIIVEHAFISNVGATDQTLLSTAAGRKKLGVADAFTVQNAGKDYNLPGIIVEHAFISNVGATDQTLLSTAAGRKKLGVADATGIAKYLGLVKGQWVQSGDKWKFRLQNGIYLKNQWYKIGAATYYFDTNGYRLTGWQKINGKQYYFTPDGVMITGWTWFGQRKYYFMPDGVMLTGWAWFGQRKYYFDANGVMATGTKEIDGQTYHFDENGVLQDAQIKTGWYTENGKKYYYENNKKVTGWKEIEGKKYYLNPSLDGAVQTGWTWFGKRKYYLYREW